MSTAKHGENCKLSSPECQTSPFSCGYELLYCCDLVGEFAKKSESNRCWFQATPTTSRLEDCSTGLNTVKRGRFVWIVPLQLPYSYPTTFPQSKQQRWKIWPECICAV